MKKQKHSPLPKPDELNETLIDNTLKRFAVKYDVAEDQSDTFTPSHTRYNVELLLDGVPVYGTTYQCNPNVTRVKGENVWECVANDAISFVNATDEANFLDEYGYLTEGVESVRKGMAAYRNCELAYNSLMKQGIDPVLVIEFFNALEENGYDAEVETTEEHI